MQTRPFAISSYTGILSLSCNIAGLWDHLPHKPGKPFQAKGSGGQVA